MLNSDEKFENVPDTQKSQDVSKDINKNEVRLTPEAPKDEINAIIERPNSESDGADIKSEEEIVFSIDSASLKMPAKGCFKRFLYILTLPFNALTYFTIPDPIKKGRAKLLPVTFIASYLWIFVYSFFITWWMATLSAAYQIDYIFIPFFGVPVGLIIRDIDKMIELRNECKDIKDPKKFVMLKEPYPCTIFQFSVATSINWLIFNAAKTTITFKHHLIYAQVLLLLAIVICRYVIVVINKFKGKKSVFAAYLIIFMIYAVGVVFIQLQKATSGK